MSHLCEEKLTERTKTSTMRSQTASVDPKCGSDWSTASVGRTCGSHCCEGLQRKNEENRHAQRALELEPVSLVIDQVDWDGHGECKDDANCMTMVADKTRQIGFPMKIWWDGVKEDIKFWPVMTMHRPGTNGERQPTSSLPGSRKQCVFWISPASSSSVSPSPPPSSSSHAADWSRASVLPPNKENGSSVLSNTDFRDGVTSKNLVSPTVATSLVLFGSTCFSFFFVLNQRTQHKPH